MKTIFLRRALGLVLGAILCGTTLLAHAAGEVGELPSCTEAKEKLCTKSYGILHLVICKGQTEIASMLIEAGEGGIDRTDGFALTPLHYAVIKENVEIVEALIGAKANLDPRDEKGRTPLIYAVCMGNAETTKLLVDAGASTQIKSNDGETPSDALQTLQNELGDALNASSQ